MVDGVCTGLEDGHTCPVDCHSECPTELATLGHERLWVVSRLDIPRDTDEALDVGFDLDGDGRRDNRWGLMYRMIDNLLKPSGVGHAIDRGELILPIRTWGELDREGAPVAVQLLPRGALAPDGDGEIASVLLHRTDTPNAVACGRVHEGVFTAGPAGWPMQAPLVLNDEWPVVVSVELRRVTVRGYLANGALHLMIGGGLWVPAAGPEALSALVSVLPAVIDADPVGAGNTLLRYYDGAYGGCGACNPPPAGCALDGVISLDELRCDTLVATLLKSDVDTTGDGIGDLLSMGYRVTATPAVLAQE